MYSKYVPQAKRKRGGGFGAAGSTTAGLLAPEKQANGSAAASSGPQLGADDTPLRPATNQELSILKRLAQVIIRMFYEDQAVMIMDQLARFDVIPADLLWSRLNVGPKDLKAHIQKLVDDRLVEVYVRSEMRPINPNRPLQPEERAPRPIRRTYYVLDLPTFYTMIKWRISRIYKSIDSMTSSVAALTSRGYLCPKCGARYDSFDAQHLIDFVTNTLRCETPGCNEALKEDEDKEMAKRKEDKMQRFNGQLGGLMAGLRMLDNIALPKLNVEVWLQLNASSTPWRAYDINDPEVRALSGEIVAIPAGRARRAEQEADADGISLATGTNSATLGGLTVDVSSVVDGPAAEEARRKRAEEESRRRREQNALPDWHLASTVSGEKTALGKEEARRKAVHAGEYAAVDADEAKRGAGAAAADQKDALAEYYASAQWGEEDDYEEVEEEEEEDEFEAVDSADTSPQVTAAPTPVAAATPTALKRSADEEASAEAPPADKKSKTEQQLPAPPAATGDDDEEEEEEFEEV